MLIFFFAIIAYYNMSSNLNYGKTNLEEILSDGKYISSSLLSGGIPANWTNDSVVKIGLTDEDYRLNHEKLVKFAELPYSKSKSRFSTGLEYFIFFEDINGTMINLTQCGFGSPKADLVIQDGKCAYVNLSRADPKNIVNIERFLIYNSTIIKMVVYTWR